MIEKPSTVELSEPEQMELAALKADYVKAQKMHTNYKGGPSMGILSELIRMGWRKSN